MKWFGDVGSSVVRVPWARPVVEENRSRARPRAPRPGSDSLRCGSEGVARGAGHEDVGEGGGAKTYLVEDDLVVTLIKSKYADIYM